MALSFMGLSAYTIATAQTNTTTPTTINVSDSILTKNAQRLGVNLGTQNFWDSGLIMRNLAFRNPGFEAETWQSILHCQFVTANSCTDDNQYTYWPANFLAGGTASFIVGPAAGTTATVTSSTAANVGVLGVTIQMSGLATPPSVGDYIVVRMNVPGNAPAGWWTWSTGGATFGTDTTDLSPNTIGKQAVSLNASGTGQGLSFSNFDDGTGGRNFITLSGSYTLSFRAKGTGGRNQVQVTFGRNLFSGSSVNSFNKMVNLTNTWQDYSYTFQATDTTQPGTLALAFALYGSSMLLDDVSITEVAAPNNPTVYRNAVVQTLENLHPGTIRYMDGGRNWGSSIDNLLTPDFARQRAGYSNLDSEMDDMPMSLHDFLVLCQTVGADPWFTMPTGMTTQEMSNLMDYFGGSASTVYGAKRAALGQYAPWTSVFGTIHLEFGNEVWNTANPGASMTDAASYGKRAGVIFSTAKSSPSYSAKSFDVILDGFEAVTYWTQTALANSNDYDTVDVATYNFANFNDASSTENIFGPMLSEPESFNSVSTGATAQQAAIAASASRPAHLAVYETNMGAIAGATTQAQNNATVPSLGAGLAVAANMLLAQRDLGVTVQNMFSLDGYNTGFNSTASSPATTSPIWGVTVDMGGPTNLRRPMFLSEELANMAILPTMYSTTQTGANPTWNQPFTTNDNFSLPNAHFLQSFAYSDGTRLNLILLNLSRTSALPVNFAGLNAPLGAATISTLTASAIDATNETQSNVAITSTSQTLAANTVLSLPAYSMTVVSAAAPYVPVMVYSVNVACANAALSPNQTTSCSGTVAGQGTYNSGVTWSTNQGTVSSTGTYTAPATLPASGNAIITATSVGDTTKSGSYTLTLAPDTITSVTASCPATTIAQGNNLTCGAKVMGTGGYSPALTWTVSAGSISPTGTLTAPTTGTSVTVTATSVQDPTKSSKVTLAVTPVLTITQPTATVTATTATVSWTINMAANSAVAYALTPGGAGYSTPYNPSTTQTPSLTITGLQPSTTYYLSPYSFVNGQTAAKSLTITTSSSSSKITGVAIACPVNSLTGGTSTTCAATVAGTGSYASTVNWSVSAGTITPAGLLAAPNSTSATTITVIATSTQDPSKSASTVLSVTPASTITGVLVACQQTTLWASSTTNCAASVTGTSNYSTAVTWSASGGSITSGGLLTAPATGTTVTVKATSTQDPTKSGSTTLTITPTLAIVGTPVVSVTSTTITVSWTVNNAQAHSGLFYGTTPAMGGITPYDPNATASPSYTLTGLTPGTTYYMAALSFIGSQSVTKALTATTSAGTSVSKVSVSCASLTLVAGNSAACSAVVAGTGSYSSGVTWKTTAGSISPSGLLSTDSSISSPTTAIVTATSTQDPTKSATVTITINPAPAIRGVKVKCSSASVVPSASTACSSAVAGTGDYSSAVTWTASAGTISPTGLLTAPATETTVTVTATSVQDSTQSGSTTVQVAQILAIADPIISVTPTTIVVSWTVTEVAVNGVRHNTGPGTPWTETRNSTPTATPSFTFTGLTPGTTYTGVIYSTNSSGTVSKDIQVTTPLNYPISPAHSAARTPFPTRCLRLTTEASAFPTVPESCRRTNGAVAGRPCGSIRGVSVAASIRSGRLRAFRGCGQGGKLKIGLTKSSIGATFAVAILILGVAAAHISMRPLAATIPTAPSTPSAPDSPATGTVIDVSPAILREDVIRLGMNLGREDFFDSQQILKNLVSQNPGFEGRQWQTVLKCGPVTPTSCGDAANDGGWTDGFLDGGTYEVITGAAAGETGTIRHSSAAAAHTGAIVEFEQPIKAIATGDYIVVRKTSEGSAIDGWTSYTGGGASLGVELRDLSPRTPGLQAMRIDASGPGQFASLTSSFGTDGARSYLSLRGPYRIGFRAKSVRGNRSLGVKLASSGMGQTLVERSVPLSGVWQDYTVDFEAGVPTRPEGSIGLSFIVAGAAVLLDDVSLEEATQNGTAFRDDVLAPLMRLRPGVLRDMDSGPNFGCGLDNMLAPRFARKRCGFNRYGTVTEDDAVGLHDFLVLAEKLGTEPWYTMQLGMSNQEAANLMEYLGGPVTTKYGAVRAALGHPVPWTTTFPRIHLEFGNEAWNTAQPGATIPDPEAYASRATAIFKMLRASPWYTPARFNLIADAQAFYPGLTGILLKTMQGVDTMSIGPYNFDTFADDSSIEHIFGPMFAEPQFMDDTVDGMVQQESHFASVADHPVKLAVYETNIGAVQGTASQASLDSTIPSLGAGIASILHELMMLRDRGITVQNTFELGGGTYPFRNTATFKEERSPVWGVVVDMGGPANRVRPSYLAEQLANNAIRPAMLTAKIKGNDPTWDQPKTANDSFALDHVHELQSFAFADASSTTLVLVNLSRTSAHTVGLSGVCAPSGEVKVETLTSAKINDTNELRETVKTVTREEHGVVPGTTTFTLPPFSMTSLVASNHGCVPAK